MITTGLALAIAGTAAAAGSITSSKIASNASKKAAETQQQAAQTASAEQRAAAVEANKLLQPYIDSGQLTLAELTDLMKSGGRFNRDFAQSDFEADPGYAFRAEEGAKAIERSAAARGKALGGSTIRSLERFRQGLASQEYQSAFDRFTRQGNERFSRLATMLGSGQGAATQAGSNTLRGAGAASEYATQGANAAASGIVGGANAVQSGISGAANNALSLAELYARMRRTAQPMDMGV